MLIVTKKMLQQFVDRRGIVTRWVVETLFPEPPIFVSNVVIDASNYSQSTQKRIKNAVSGFISFASKQFFVNDVIKRIDYKEKVSRSDVRFALMLSLYLNDGVQPPYDVRFSDVKKERIENGIAFAMHFRYTLNGKVLSPQTVALFRTLSAFKHDERDKVVRRKKLFLGLKEKEKVDVFKREMERNIKIVYTK